jgi:hypothetical protein
MLNPLQYITLLFKFYKFKKCNSIQLLFIYVPTCQPRGHNGNNSNNSINWLFKDAVSIETIQLRMIGRFVNVEDLVEWELAGETKYSEKTGPSDILSTTNYTWPDLVSGVGRRIVKPATNSLSHGTAQ